MIIPEVAPMLTCVAKNDGFTYEFVLRVKEGESPVTRVRIGPYLFTEEFTPKPLFGPFSSGGPENGYWMNGWMPFLSTPVSWSTFRWEVAADEPESPTYLVARGILTPGNQGIFRFTSMFPPGGLRTGLEVFRGQEHRDFGVSGPNYEKFLRGDHPH